MAAQYWRREDFPSVYGIINPIVNVIQAFGPMIITMIGLRFGFHITLGIIGISGVVALILICLVNPEHIRKMDNKYREAAGLPVDKLP